MNADSSGTRRALGNRKVPASRHGAGQHPKRSLVMWAGDMDDFDDPYDEEPYDPCPEVDINKPLHQLVHLAEQECSAAEAAARQRHPRRKAARPFEAKALEEIEGHTTGEIYDKFQAQERKKLKHLEKETKRLVKENKPTATQDRDHHLRETKACDLQEAALARRQNGEAYPWERGTPKARLGQADEEERRRERFHWGADRYMYWRQAKRPDKHLMDGGGPYWRCVELTEACLALPEVKKHALDRPIQEPAASTSTAAAPPPLAAHVLAAYNAAIPDELRRDFGSIKKNLAHDDPRGDRNTAPGGYWGWARKTYRFHRDYAYDVRMVCCNTMHVFKEGDPAYRLAHALLTGGVGHFPSLPVCIDRQLLVLAYEEWDRDADAANAVDACDLASKAKGYESSARQADAVWRGIKPYLEFYGARWHASKLVEELAAHPCATALERCYLQPTSFPPNAQNALLVEAYEEALGGECLNVDDQRITLDDVLERQKQGKYDDHLCLVRLEGDLVALFEAATRWYATDHDCETYELPSQCLTHTKLAHMADACKAFFLTGFPECRAGGSGERLPRIFSRLETLNRLELEQVGLV